MGIWGVPIIYFMFCESLVLISDLSIQGVFNDTIGFLSALIFSVITMPLQPAGGVFRDWVSRWLNISPIEHSILLRVLAEQFIILAGLVPLLLLTWVINIASKDLNKGSNP